MHFYLYNAKSQQKPSKGNIIERMCSVAINLDQLVGLLFLSIFFFLPVTLNEINRNALQPKLMSWICLTNSQKLQNIKFTRMYDKAK